MTPTTPATASRLTRLRDVLVVWTLPAFPFLFIGIPLHDPPRTLSVPKVILLVTVATWIATVAEGRVAALRRPPLLVLGAYVAAVLAGAVAVPSGWYALREVLIVLFIVGVWTRPPTAAETFWRNLAVVAALVSAWAVVLWLRTVPLTSPATQLIGTRTVAASFLVAVLLRSAATRRWAATIPPLVGLVALRSVGAWLGVAAGVLVLWRNRGGRALLLAAVYTTAVLTVAVNVPIGPHGDSDLVPTFWNTSVMPRLYGWRVVAGAVRQAPWLGHGLGMFPQVFLDAEARAVPLERRPWWRRAATGQPAPGMPAHDDFVRITVESGLPAAALWLVAMLLFLRETRGHRVATALLLAFLVETLPDNLYMLSNVAPVIFTAVSLARRDGAEVSMTIARKTRATGGTASREGLEPGAGVEPATY